MAAVFPKDEIDRLAALRSYAVLDTPSDKRFDGLLDIVTQHFNVPISLVSLVDEDRQWFKATRGMDAKQTPRNLSFCAHAILSPNEIFVVENAEADPRFRDNALVKGDPSIRFYAGAPILAENKQPLGTLCIIDRKPRRISESEKTMLRSLATSAEAMLELHYKNIILAKAATRDPLTGLTNRRGFDTELSKAIEGSLSGRPFGLLYLDLDGFKSVNDTYGHDAGDALLQHVGRVMLANAGEGDLPVRLGGDEFAFIVRSPNEEKRTESIAQLLITQIGQLTNLQSGGVSISASIGGAFAPSQGTTPTEIRRAADGALYAAKRAGGSRLVIAGHAEQEYLNDTNAGMVHDLRLAIEENALTLELQPYFECEGREMVGCEALVRWNQPGVGPISPSVFVPVAETSGLIGALDKWVLYESCKAALDMPEPMKISVNISAYWISRGELGPTVRSILTKTGLSPTRLVLELTERTTVVHTDEAFACMAQLRDIGVAFALDDFGIGYSSLSILRQLPFEKLKIDRSFVNDLGTDQRADATVRAMIDLGHALGMQVCGEGIETEEQLEFLRRSECDHAQGYLLAKPGWRRAAV